MFPACHFHSQLQGDASMIRKRDGSEYGGNLHTGFSTKRGLSLHGSVKRCSNKVLFVEGGLLCVLRGHRHYSLLSLTMMTSSEMFCRLLATKQTNRNKKLACCVRKRFVCPFELVVLKMEPPWMVVASNSPACQIPSKHHLVIISILFYVPCCSVSPQLACASFISVLMGCLSLQWHFVMPTIEKVLPCYMMSCMIISVVPRWYGQTLSWKLSLPEKNVGTENPEFLAKNIEIKTVQWLHQST